MFYIVYIKARVLYLKNIFIQSSSCIWQLPKLNDFKSFKTLDDKIKINIKVYYQKKLAPSY